MTASRWRSERLKHVADVAFSSVDKKSVDGEVPVRLCNYTDVYYKDEITADVPFMEATASHDQVRAFGLQAGDVLITKDSETADDIGVGAFVSETLDGVVCGYHLAVLRPKPEGIDPKYLFWSVCGSGIRQQMTVFASGVTRFGLRFGDMGNLQLFLPDLATQRAIADFLDRETARLDELKARKRGLRDLLESRRRALVDSIVGRSGAPVVRVKSTVRAITSGPRGWSERYSEAGRVFLRIANVSLSSIDLLVDDLVRVTPPEGPEAERTRAEEGDVVVSITAEIGAVGVVPHELAGCHISQHLALLRTNTRVVEPNWLALCLFGSGAQAQLDSARYGGTKTQLSLEDVAQVRLPLPPLHEQRVLVTQWREEDAATNLAIRKLDDQLRLLREHRQALITAAVTGQIGKTGEAA